jgi:hypothetical protein
VLLYYNQLVRNQEAYRFALDFDFSGPAEESDEYLARVMAIAQRVVCKYRPDHDNEVVVCRNMSARTDAFGFAQRLFGAKKLRSRQMMLAMNGGQTPPSRSDCLHHLSETVENFEQRSYTMGLHPMWDFFTTVDQALQICESVKHALQKEMPLRGEGYNRWDKIVDAGPLEKGNLRLVGSYKLSKSCVICSKWREIRSRCPGCHGHGRALDARNYMPYMILRGADATVDGVALDALLQTPLDMAIRCSLHAPVGQGASFQVGRFRVPEGEPKLVPRAVRAYPRTITYNSGHTERLVSRDFPEDRKSWSGMHFQKFYVTQDDVRWRLLEEVIQTTLNPHYKDTSIKSIITTKRGAYYLVNVKGYYDRYCQNIGREHNSNTVWFKVTRNKTTRCGEIVQKCHCKCADKTCKDYTSHVSTLSQFVTAALFNRKEKENVSSYERSMGDLKRPADPVNATSAASAAAGGGLWHASSSSSSLAAESDRAEDLYDTSAEHDAVAGDDGDWNRSLFDADVDGGSSAAASNQRAASPRPPKDRPRKRVFTPAGTVIPTGLGKRARMNVSKYDEYIAITDGIGV